MGVSESVLPEEARNLLKKPLAELGYKLEPSPPSDFPLIWFVKSPQKPSDMFYIIELQPSGFELDDDFFDAAINLYRRTTRNEFNSEKQEAIPAQIPTLRLTPRLWGETGPGSGHDKWWHFISVEDLQDAYEDILQKLKNYAIPFLEDPNSTWRSGMGL